MKVKITVTNIMTDKLIREDTYELEVLLTRLLNELEDKVNRDRIGAWRKFSVEIVEK